MTGPIHVDFRKWPEAVHWQFAMHHLGSDDHGTWMWAPAGTPLRRGDEPEKTASSDFVVLIKPEAWWTALWNRSDRYDVYVDVITPAAWDGNRVTMIDLDLDVLRTVDGAVEVHDEDEFEHHRLQLGYPDAVVDRARAVTAWAALQLERRAEPFDTVGAAWLDRTP